MTMTPLSGYWVPQKLHPLSLLAQLTSRNATGNLRVFTQTASWSINLEDGKLTYAFYSDKLFDRLDYQLQRLSPQIPSINSATRGQMRLMFEPKDEHQSMPYADYKAICWLIKQKYITPTQAETLIDELAKEVLETFLVLKEGNYEFSLDSSWEKLPKFCHLDLRLLVEFCQQKLRKQPNIQPKVNSGEGSPVLPRKNSPQTQSEFPQQFSQPNNFETAQNNNSQNSQPGKQRLYTIACIDDSQTVLNSIKLFLDSNKFLVVTINDPVKALMQILRSKPDLILLDVEMPNLDGYELCSLLRRHSAFKDTPIIMVTGRTGFIDKAKAKIVRSSGYLTKPFTQAELLKMLFKYLD
ncbi:response regulator [Nodularia spumigena]|uniref:Protein PatA n=2 Tax=Cyanophyceae TaxID=3028117 RepID=A0A166KD25_NODSP|nr:response regulator [Nodularia spumigena]MDB9354963.1 response regulator [Nodularia spumigena CS-587/03]MDB9401791.1 response regulator [Microcystis aeruginosa CS-567/02-A1]KZL50932.1 two-component system response regulator [Nodularia spumigena CENA596]MDB9304661.1 response regulator [Nodularia spumigena CS-591/12]MDB9319313.1 response regulator [Nodularia spumigena CS-590/01A]